MSFKSISFAVCGLIATLATADADEAYRNYGATELATAPVVAPAVPAVVSESTTTISGGSAIATVAFGHRRHCCGYGVGGYGVGGYGGGGYGVTYGGYGGGFPALYNAYSTYQPTYYPRYYSGYYGAYNVGSYPYVTPNPYGYYPNGAIWGSSGPTYMRPFPVWGSPSGIYDYRYQGWGSYGWGGWGGTGPAGWGYQGGFYW